MMRPSVFMSESADIPTQSSSQLGCIDLTQSEGSNFLWPF